MQKACMKIVMFMCGVNVHQDTVGITYIACQSS
jgi:hypothetical protein